MPAVPKFDEDSMIAMVYSAIGGFTKPAEDGRPFLLVDPENKVWVSDNGPVAIKTCRVTAEGLEPLEEIIRVEEGEIFCTAPPVGHIGLLAVPLRPDAGLWCFKMERLELAAEDPELLAFVEELVEQWVLRLSTAVVESQPFHPRSDYALAAHDQRDIQLHTRRLERVRARNRLAWVAPLRGNYSYLDLAELDEPAGIPTEYLPLTEQTWLTCLEDGELQAVSTHSLFLREALALEEKPAEDDGEPRHQLLDESLAHFHGQACMVLALTNQRFATRSVDDDEFFLLDGADKVWLVRSGSLKIYSVALVRGMPSGDRTLFMEVARGELVFGMDFEKIGSDIALIANSGEAGTVLYEMNVADLRDLAANEQYSRRVGQLIDDWVKRVSRRAGASMPFTPPESDLVLVGEDTPMMTLEWGKYLSSHGQQVFWVGVLEGVMRFFSNETVALGGETSQGDVLFPVAAGAWLESLAENTTLTLMSSGQALAMDAFWRGLERFHQELCRAEGRHKKAFQLSDYTADREFPVEGEENVWLVARGKLELFRAEFPEQDFSQSRLTRTSFMVVEAGGLVFGQQFFPVETNGNGGQPRVAGLLATGESGTQVFRFHRSFLEELSADARYAPLVAEKIAAWCGKLTAGLRMTRPFTPEASVRAEAKTLANQGGATRRRLNPEELLGVTDGVIWARPAARGRILWSGETAPGERAMTANFPGRLWPATQESYIYPAPGQPELELDTWDTLGALRQQSFWTSLLSFQQEAMATEARSRREYHMKRVTGDTPFDLSRPDTCYLVAQGNADIFVVDWINGQRAGARAPFMSCPKGELMFGADPAHAGVGLLAVGGMGCLVYEFSVQRLRHELESDPARRTLVTKMIETWLQKLPASSMHPRNRPRIEMVLEPGGENAELIQMREGDRARANKGQVVWVELLAGFYNYANSNQRIQAEDRILFPISSEDWIERRRGDGNRHLLSDIQVLPSETALMDTRAWRGLNRFNGEILRVLKLNREASPLDELERVERKRRLSERARESANRALAGIFGAQASASKDPLRGEEPAMFCLRMVMNFLEIKTSADLSGFTGRTISKGWLENVGRSAHFRFRVTRLKDKAWWSKEQHPLLANFKDDNWPVAIMPAREKATSFSNCLAVWMDPETGQRQEQIIDPLFAEKITFGAFLVYRPFPEGALSAMQVIRFGMWGLGKERKTLAAMGLLVAILAMAIPAATGRIFESIIPGAEKLQLFHIFIGLVIAALSSGLFEYIRGVAMVRTEGAMDFSIQAALWDRILNLPANFFGNYTAGDLANRAFGIDTIREKISGVGAQTLMGSITSLGSAVMMFVYNPKLAKFALLLVGVLVVVTIVINVFFIMPDERKRLDNESWIAGLVEQLLKGVNKLRSCGAENSAMEQWARNFASQNKLVLSTGTRQNYLEVFNGFYEVACPMILFFAIYKLNAQAEASGGGQVMTTGQFTAFNAAFGAFFNATKDLSKASVDLFNIIPAYEKLRPIVIEKPEISDGVKPPGKLQGEISLSGCYFKYTPDGPDIINNLSLTIRPKEYVAFVGPSGSGKSTVMRMLLGFEKPYRGSVLYDKQDLSTLDVTEVRQQIGVVLQTSQLIPASIKQNIIGDVDLPAAEAQEMANIAAKRAGCYDEILAMPMNWATVVSEGGGTFSGGQRQRIMIARSIARVPKILFFDEATSALDNRSQDIVSKSLDAMEATRIAIAHRLNTIRKADTIYVLVRGQIAEKGGYDELIEKGGIFAELAKRQSA
jgi:NHLM bacteriocin system ABC transporter ATP-binding protein